MVILGNGAWPDQSRLDTWKLDGSIPLEWWRWSKPCSRVGGREWSDKLEHVTLQMSVVLEKARRSGMN